MRRWFSALSALVAIMAGAAPALAARVSLAGQVTYRERIALPDSSSLRIQLLDQSLPSAPPRLDVAAPIGAGQVPLGFKLSFEDSVILPSHSYALIAAISTNGHLLFRNFQPYPVDPLHPQQPVLIVTNLVGQASASAPTPPTSTTSQPAIVGSTWSATAIAGAAVVSRATPSLTIGADMRAGGSGGCNSWYAEAMLKKDEISFGAVTSTLKGCTQSISQQEKAYFDALRTTATWQVAGDTLTLYDAAGKPLVTYTR